MMNALHTGLTIESMIHNKRILHNGMLGVYEDLAPVSKKMTDGLAPKIAGLHNYLQARTGHTITSQTFGVLVSATSQSDEIGRAFVGYDEGVDFNARLCYATDTFLAMELAQLIRNFDLRGTEVKKGELLPKVSVESTKEVLAQESPEQPTIIGEVDCGWGILGEQGVLAMLEDKVTRLETSLTNQKILTKAEGKGLKVKMLKVVQENKDKLTKAPEFEEGTVVFKVMKELLDVIKMIVPKTTIEEGSNMLTWELPEVGTILTLYHKELVTEGLNDGGRLVTMTGSPVYKGIEKLVSTLISNIGYATWVSKSKSAPTKVTTPLNKVSEKVKEEVEPKVNDSKQDYYDMYLAHAGKWGKSDNRYKELKGMVESIVPMYDIAGVTLRGVTKTEVVLDWVIDKKTYTMGITERATRVKELEGMYDVAIAYDVTFPELVEVLMKDKIEQFLSTKG